MKNPHIEYFKVAFEKHRKAWDDKHDDRRIFCVKYDKLIEAYTVAENISNNTINCALNEYSEKEITVMQEIVDYFTGKSSRDGYYYKGGMGK